MGIVSLSSKYIFFAVVSTIGNIASQWVFFELYSGFLSLYIGLFIGTVIGLVIKYVLDKKYIFFYETKTKKEEGRTFFLYSFMGVFTTLIFWGSEISFYFLFDFKNAELLGGLLGLSIGYIVKYNLDKKYVFKGD